MHAENTRFSDHHMYRAGNSFPKLEAVKLFSFMLLILMLLIQKLSQFQGLFPEDYDKRTAPPKINEGKIHL